MSSLTGLAERKFEGGQIGGHIEFRGRRESTVAQQESICNAAIKRRQELSSLKKKIFRCSPRSSEEIFATQSAVPNPLPNVSVHVEGAKGTDAGGIVVSGIECLFRAHKLRKLVGS